MCKGQSKLNLLLLTVERFPLELVLLFYTECGMGKHYGGIFADVFYNYPLPCRAFW